jgi:hypothetical protein
MLIFRQPLKFEELCTQIALSGIWQYYNDLLAFVLRSRRHLQSGPGGSA